MGLIKSTNEKDLIAELSTDQEGDSQADKPIEASSIESENPELDWKSPERVEFLEITKKASSLSSKPITVTRGEQEVDIKELNIDDFTRQEFTDLTGREDVGALVSNMMQVERTLSGPLDAGAIDQPWATVGDRSAFDKLKATPSESPVTVFIDGEQVAISELNLDDLSKEQWEELLNDPGVKQLMQASAAAKAAQPQPDFFQNLGAGLKRIFGLGGVSSSGPNKPSVSQWRQRKLEASQHQSEASSNQLASEINALKTASVFGALHGQYAMATTAAKKKELISQSNDLYSKLPDDHIDKQRIAELGRGVLNHQYSTAEAVKQMRASNQSSDRVKAYLQARKEDLMEKEAQCELHEDQSGLGDILRKAIDSLVATLNNLFSTKTKETGAAQPSM